MVGLKISFLEFPSGVKSTELKFIQGSLKITIKSVILNRHYIPYLAAHVFSQQNIHYTV